MRVSLRAMLALAMAWGVSASPVAAELTPWNVPHGALFFRAEAGDRWPPMSTHAKEWILLACFDEYLFRVLDVPDLEKSLTIGPVDPASDWGAEPWRPRALGDLARAVDPAWLPRPEDIGIFSAQRDNKPIRWSARVAGVGPNARILILHTFERDTLLYLEQPDPLPAGTDALRAEDVLRPEVLAAHTAALAGGEPPPYSLMVRALSRYRATAPGGPYEPVRILLIHLAPADGLTLRSPGN